MRTSVQKPTKEMINEAHRLAFFSDETLSSEILSDKTKLREYISINQKKLIDNGVIKAKRLAPEFSSEVLKQRKAWLNKLARYNILFPLAIYAVFAVVILSTSVTDGLHFHHFVLEWFPEAQGWVNISPVFREKMLYLYPVFYICFFYMLIATSLAVLEHRHKFYTPEFIPLKNGMCKKSSLMLITICLLIFFVVEPLASSSLLGSQEFLLPHQLDNDGVYLIFRDSFKWNTIFGVIFDKSVPLAMLGYSILLIPQSIATIKWCSKYND